MVRKSKNAASQVAEERARIGAQGERCISDAKTSWIFKNKKSFPKKVVVFPQKVVFIPKKKKIVFIQKKCENSVAALQSTLNGQIRRTKQVGRESHYICSWLETDCLFGGFFSWLKTNCLFGGFFSWLGTDCLFGVFFSWLETNCLFGGFYSWRETDCLFGGFYANMLKF